MSPLAKALCFAAGGIIPIIAVIHRWDCTWIATARTVGVCLHCDHDDRRRIS